MSPASRNGSRSRIASLRRVRVGSLNAPKLAAVRGALASYASDVEIEGVDVPSGVPEQPVGFHEIVTGACNRARAAFSSAPGCDLAVGIEDGLVDLRAVGAGADAAWVNIGCAALTDGVRTATGFSSAFAYPPECAETASRNRAPIGELFDELWTSYDAASATSALPSAKSVGNVGKLTLGVMPRHEYVRHAVLCALVSFLHPELYPATPTAAVVVNPV